MPREPGLDRDLVAQGTPVRASHHDPGGHGGESAVLDNNRHGVALHPHAGHRVVQSPGLEPPGAPEPTEVAARGVLERIPEVPRRRVAIAPPTPILTHRLAKSLLAQKPAQACQVGRHLVVARDGKGGGAIRIEITVPHQLDLASLTRKRQIILPGDPFAVVPPEEVAHRLCLVETRYPLVHPGVPLLVRAHLHREPHVGQLVDHHAV
jgi:hypothetical protein